MEKIDLDAILRKYDFKIYTMDISENSKKVKVTYKGFIKYNITKTLNVGTSLLTGLKGIVGGNLVFLNDLLEQSRLEVIVEMIKEAVEKNANAIVGMRIDVSYGNNHIAIFGYGTGVRIE